VRTRVSSVVPRDWGGRKGFRVSIRGSGAVEFGVGGTREGGGLLQERVLAAG